MKNNFSNDMWMLDSGASCHFCQSAEGSTDIKEINESIKIGNGNLISQKNSYHRVFDVKYDLRHKARIVLGGNWTVNETQDIYSAGVCMDTVRIKVFIGELCGLSGCSCVIVKAFL
jgi:hypothetical protein